MATVQVSSADGTRRTYSDAELRRLWHDGVLDNSSTYFIEGMAESRPLREYFDSVVTDQQLVEQLNLDDTLSFTKDPNNLTTVLKGLLGLSLLVAVANLVCDVWQWNLLTSSEISLEEAEANDTRQALVGVAAILGLVVTGIVFLSWQHRANLNCRGFGASGMKFSPGWSIGYYFIPIVMLFKPYQAMKEIWKVSSNPRDWESQPGSPYLSWWWALWLLTGFAGQISTRLSLRADTPETLKTSTFFAILSDGFDIAVHVAAFLLVTKIIEMQNKLVHDQFASNLT